MKYFSMFSGIGGFELGIGRAFCNMQSAEVEQNKEGRDRNTDKVWRNVLPTGRTTPLCVGYSEIDKYAIKIYEKHFKGHKNYGDARRIIPKQLPNFDMLCGGFPCQAFSIAGKRGGFEDTRGTLFYEIARITAVKRPQLLFLENVRGLLSHDNGRTFGTILTTFSDLGYILEWQVLNSKDFGVPQNRERVFIIGHLGERCGKAVFPIETCGKKDYDQITSAFVSTYYKGLCSDARTGIIELTKEQSQGYRVYDTDGIATTLASQAGGVGAKTGLYAIPVLTPDRAVKRQNGRRFKEDGDPAFTITSQDRHGVLIDDMKIRRLTPKEAERLQGFPDDWTADLSDTQRYKCLGNAVTVNVIEAIVRELFKEPKP